MEFADRIACWQTQDLRTNEISYSWAILTLKGQPLISSTNNDSFSGEYITNLVENGKYFFDHLPDWTQGVLILGEIPRRQAVAQDKNCVQSALNHKELKEIIKFVRSKY